MTTKSPDLSPVIVAPDHTLERAMAQLDRAGTGALAVCDPDRRLLGLLTDGDIRRALLAEAPLSAPCSRFCTQDPVTVRDPVTPDAALLLMNQRDINQLPVLDDDGILVALLRRNELLAADTRELHRRDRLSEAVVSPDLSIAEAMGRLDAAGTGAVLLCDQERRLLGVLTDGDIRRSVLRGASLDRPCHEVASRDPVTVDQASDASAILQLMNDRDIDQVPVVTADGTVVDLLLRKDLAGDESQAISAVIMAGGFGSRLMPLTRATPKPMLPVGDRPLLERTIERLERAGVRDVSLATHYLPESILEHFGDGAQFGVRLNYSQEDQPLGTAGGLRLLPRPDGPMLVMNGDILTDVSVERMLAFHREHAAVLTVGVRRYEIEVPFGVIDCEDVWVTGLREKPRQEVFINAGVYLLAPAALDAIPADRRFDMTDLIQLLLDQQQPVVSFPILEYWLDVGRHQDLQRAEADVRDGRI